MKSSILTIISDAQSRLSGHVMLLSYNYYNICVKAEAIALLSVTVTSGDTTFDIEEVANVSNPDPYMFDIYPKNEELIIHIAKAIMKAHPEFKMEELKTEEIEEIPDYKSQRYLRFTMPEVDSDRRDTYIDMTNMLFDQTNIKIEAIDTATMVKINREAVRLSPQEIDEANSQYKELYQQLKESAEKFRDDKLAEIDEAYQRYLTAESELAQQQSDIAASANPNAGFEMNINSEE